MQSNTSHRSLRSFGWCFILLSIVLAAGCGGGGGSGGSSGGGPTIIAPTAPTYTYSTFNQIVASGNNFSDYDIAAANYRYTNGDAGTGCYSITTQMADFQLRYDAQLNAVVTIQNVAGDCLTQLGAAKCLRANTINPITIEKAIKVPKFNQPLVDDHTMA